MHAPLPSIFGPDSSMNAAGGTQEGTGADPSADSSIGLLLQQDGKLTADNVERVICAQQELGLRFGDAAVRLGLVNQHDIDAAIARQFAYPVAARGDSPLSPRLVAAFHPASAHADTLRAIRSQLLLRWFGTGRHALAVTGAGPGDASSVLAANLAVVFAQLGQRTLLVDANLRHGVQHTLFGFHARHDVPGPDDAWLDQSQSEFPRSGQLAPGRSWPGPSWPGRSWPGLSDILAGRARLDAILPVAGFSELSVLPSGTVPPNPQELLERASFAALHAELGNRYDVVLYDVAPTSHGAEALAVATHAGATLLAALKDATPLTVLKRLAHQMAAAQIAVIGSVLVEA